MIKLNFFYLFTLTIRLLNFLIVIFIEKQQYKEIMMLNEIVFYLLFIRLLSLTPLYRQNIKIFKIILSHININLQIE